MSENNDRSPEAPESPEVQATPASDTPTKRTFRERVADVGSRLHGTRGLIAATLAALIVGGLGGAAIHSAVDDDGDRRDRDQNFGGRHPGDGGRDFHRQAPGDS